MLQDGYPVNATMGRVKPVKYLKDSWRTKLSSSSIGGFLVLQFSDYVAPDICCLASIAGPSLPSR